MKVGHKKYYITIGKNLRDLRKDKGLSQQDLANRCNIDRAKISRIENATEDFMLSTLIELTIALDVSLEKLFRTEK